jgi:PAS domain S-box-containing protein
MMNKDAAESTFTAGESAGILAQSEALFTSIGDGAIATDEFGRIIRINPVALNILEYSEKEVLGEWFPKIVVALDDNLAPVSLIDRPITKAFLTGQSISEKMVYRTKHGNYRPVQVTVSPILLHSRPIGAIEVFRDITLEREVDRMKSEFISLASHQLRTPLSAIKTYSHMLIDGYMGDLSPAQKKALRTILGASNRMNELVNMLLNVSRIESGSIAVNPKMHNANKLVEEVAKELQLSAAEQQITINLRLPKNPPTIRTDNLIAKEVLINLVSNAIKYTPENGQVTIRLIVKERELVFVVTDTGVGIPKHSQDHVFTKFFRAQNVIRKETTGTGLGLYLVKGLVENLGGKVWFESEEDIGTSFYFSLPRTKKTTRRSKS